MRALVKLEQVLPSHLRRRVQALTGATQTLQVYGGPQVDPQCLTALAAAVPRPRARALRLHRARQGRHAPRGRAARARQRRPPLVPRRLRLRPRGLAHVPRRPDRQARLDRRALHAAHAARPRTPPPTSPRACSPTPRATRRASRSSAPRRSSRAARWLGGDVTPLGEHRCELRTSDDNLDWLAMRIAMLPAPYVVHGPPELIERLRAIAAGIGAPSAAGPQQAAEPPRARARRTARARDLRPCGPAAPKSSKRARDPRAGAGGELDDPSDRSPISGTPSPRPGALARRRPADPVVADHHVQRVRRRSRRRPARGRSRCPPGTRGGRCWRPPRRPSRPRRRGRRGRLRAPRPPPAGPAARSRAPPADRDRAGDRRRVSSVD